MNRNNFNETFDTLKYAYIIRCQQFNFIFWDGTNDRVHASAAMSSSEEDSFLLFFVNG